MTENAVGRGTPYQTPRLGLNFIMLAGAELLNKLLAAIAFAFLARILGPAAYGELEFVLAIVFFFVLLVDCGLSYYAAREVARGRESVGQLFAPVLLAKMLLAVLCLALLAGLTAWLDVSPAARRLLLLYGLTLIPLLGLIPWAFQGRDMMHVVAGASTLRMAVFSAGVFLLVRSPARLWAAAMVEGMAIGSAAIYYLVLVWHNFRPLTLRMELRASWSALRQALPIGASDLVWGVKVFAPTVLLGLLVGGSQVGWYGAAHRIVVSLHAFASLYFFNLVPSIARTTRAEPSTLQRLMATSLRLTCSVGICIGLVGTVVAPPVTRFLYGPGYGEASAVLRLLIWLVPLSLLSGHYRHTLIAYDLQRLEFLSGACGAGLSVVLNVGLIPRYGWVGAACGLLVSEMTVCAVTYYLVRRRVAHVAVWPHLRIPLGVGAILLIVLYFVPFGHKWLVDTLTVVIYVLAVLLTQRDLWDGVRAMFPGRQH